MNSTKLSFEQLRSQAIALRRAGKSRRQIQEILGVTNNEALTRMVAGEPPPAWTRRPRAKDELRARARQLRGQGLAYQQIAAELGVSKSSVSLWVRDLPRPGRLSYDAWRERSAAARREYWDAQRPINEARRETARAAAAAQIGSLSDRETLIAGAVAYWCEGAKNKPYHRHDRVIFTNSDPALVLFFLRFIDAAGVARDRLTYRLQIHENAAVAAAQQFWLTLTGAEQSQFRKVSLKRHNPKTVRKNSGAGYHGCLRIEVRRSSSLYHQIEGWARAALAGKDSHLPGQDSNR